MTYIFEFSDFCSVSLFLINLHNGAIVPQSDSVADFILLVVAPASGIAWYLDLVFRSFVHTSVHQYLRLP